MNMDNSLHQSHSVVERVFNDPSFHFMCGLFGSIMYLFTYYFIYRMFIKIYPQEQEQFYLRNGKKKYHCEYESTIAKFKKMRVL